MCRRHKTSLKGICEDFSTFYFHLPHTHLCVYVRLAHFLYTSLRSSNSETSQCLGMSWCPSTKNISKTSTEWVFHTQLCLLACLQAILQPKLPVRVLGIHDYITRVCLLPLIGTSKQTEWCKEDHTIERVILHS
jgi:hypothetical protein